VSARHVDDAQPCGGQRRRPVDEHAGVVRPSMAQGGNHPLGAIGLRRLIVEPEVASDTTHDDFAFQNLWRPAFRLR
jgi:hypothetical protein